MPTQRRDPILFLFFRFFFFYFLLVTVLSFLSFRAKGSILYFNTCCVWLCIYSWKVYVCVWANNLLFAHFSCAITCLYLWTIRGKGRRPRSFAMYNGPIKSTSGNKMDGWRSTSPECDIKNSSFARRYTLLLFNMAVCGISLFRKYFLCCYYGLGSSSIAAHIHSACVYAIHILFIIRIVCAQHEYIVENSFACCPG